MTKGWLFPLRTLLLFPVFCKTALLVWEPVRPLRNGTLLGLMMLFMLPRLLMLLPFKSGDAPWSGKSALLVLENGMPLISELAMTPVTTLADGWDPPNMSCMKKDKTGSCGPGFDATVALAPCPVVADVAPGPAIGATPAATGAAGLATGCSSSASSSLVTGTVGVTTGTWPLGNVLGVTGVAAGFDGWATTSSRTLAEFEQVKMMARNKMQVVDLNVLLVSIGVLAILGT